MQYSKRFGTSSDVYVIPLSYVVSLNTFGDIESTTVMGLHVSECVWVSVWTWIVSTFGIAMFVSSSRLSRFRGSHINEALLWACNSTKSQRWTQRSLFHLVPHQMADALFFTRYSIRCKASINLTHFKIALLPTNH